MGLFDFLFGKKKEAESSCILGVINVIGIDDSATDLIIEGLVQGTLKVGDELVVTKISCLSKTPVKTVITSIYVNEEEVQEASEKVVKVTVKVAFGKRDRYSGLLYLSFCNGYRFCKATRWNTH